MQQIEQMIGIALPLARGQGRTVMSETKFTSVIPTNCSKPIFRFRFVVGDLAGYGRVGQPEKCEKCNSVYDGSRSPKPVPARNLRVPECPDSSYHHDRLHQKCDCKIDSYP